MTVFCLHGFCHISTCKLASWFSGKWRSSFVVECSPPLVLYHWFSLVHPCLKFLSETRTSIWDHYLPQINTSKENWSGSIASRPFLSHFMARWPADGDVTSRFMLTEFLPIQIILKTLAPIIFGGRSSRCPCGWWPQESPGVFGPSDVHWIHSSFKSPESGEHISDFDSRYHQIAKNQLLKHPQLIPSAFPIRRGLVQGALASAATETLAACCNFLIGRNFLKDPFQWSMGRWWALGIYIYVMVINKQ